MLSNMQDKIKKRPFFSIITCTYNSEKYLPINISSVQKQTFRNFEHIFIDGNSTDKTKQIIKAYKKGKKNIRDYYYPPKGVTNAMNIGIKLAKGQYIIYLNSDDNLYENKVLEKVSNFINDNDRPDWIYGKINLIDGNNQGNLKFPGLNYFHTSHPWLLKYYNYIPHQAVFINRNIFKMYGPFNEKYVVMPDYEYWLRIGNKTRWIFINKVISNYRVWAGAGSYSESFQKLNKRVMLSYHRKYTNIFQHVAYILINFYLTKIYMAIKSKVIM